ncbi:hypothetical protein ARMGADRAFT_1040584 [Armillaria gallica]|uniref:Uncharacterized protein n=1 Tax=Armillaria gallica TaxID=47427 RepID=A0A2H3CUD3_ARMGA|nr:hypothetical protein ARMGADRAFT_1040584 [Armillaria gallica]
MLQHTISKNSGAAGMAGPMERNQQNTNTKSSTLPSKKKCCSRSSRTWAHGNNKAQTPNKCNSAAHHFEKQCGISSGARAHETTTHGNENNEHPRAQERERGARRTVTREDDGGREEEKFVSSPFWLVQGPSLSSFEIYLYDRGVSVLE